MPFIGLFTEDGLDQIVGTEAEKNKEKRDLLAMGCSVDCYVTEDESDLHAIDEGIRNGSTFSKARGRVESNKARHAKTGHACEERADSLEGEARAVALEDAAKAFDLAGGPHYPARAKACREAAQEARKATAPTLESIVQEHEATVNLAPTWAGIMPGLIAALQNGTAQGQAMAREELMRLAEQVDRINGRSVGAMENPAAPAPRKARLKSRKELEDMARDKTARPIARELASMGLAVASCGQSGGFPLYAFRDARPLSPDQLDSLIYDQEGAFQ